MWILKIVYCISIVQWSGDILKNQKEKLKSLKVRPIEFKDSVFLCRDGTPTKNSAYDTKLFYYCDKADIQRFSMHVLRHTFATRCIESGMRPKMKRQRKYEILKKCLKSSEIGTRRNIEITKSACF